MALASGTQSPSAGIQQTSPNAHTASPQKLSPQYPMQSVGPKVTLGGRGGLLKGPPSGCVGSPTVRMTKLSRMLHVPSALMSQNASSKNVTLGGRGGLSGTAGGGGCVGSPAIEATTLSTTLTLQLFSGSPQRQAHPWPGN